MSLVSLHGRVVATGGYDNLGKASDTIEELDISELKWKMLEITMGLARGYHSSAVIPRKMIEDTSLFSNDDNVSKNNVIFITGGRSSKKSTEVLDLNGNCSGITGKLPDQRFSHTSSLVHTFIGGIILEHTLDFSVSIVPIYQTYQPTYQPSSQTTKQPNNLPSNQHAVHCSMNYQSINQLV